MKRLDSLLYARATVLKLYSPADTFWRYISMLLLRLQHCMYAWNEVGSGSWQGCV